MLYALLISGAHTHTSEHDKGWSKRFADFHPHPLSYKAIQLVSTLSTSRLWTASGFWLQLHSCSLAWVTINQIIGGVWGFELLISKAGQQRFEPRRHSGRGLLAKSAKRFIIKFKGLAQKWREEILLRVDASCVKLFKVELIYQVDSCW